MDRTRCRAGHTWDTSGSEVCFLTAPVLCKGSHLISFSVHVGQNQAVWTTLNYERGQCATLSSVTGRRERQASEKSAVKERQERLLVEKACPSRCSGLQVVLNI